MTEREFEKLMTNLKDSPELGGDFSAQEWNNSISKVWSELEIDPELNRPEGGQYTTKEYLQFVLWSLFYRGTRTVTVALSVFMIVLTGWVATVNASYGSLPGDKLYGVKIVSERVQLTLANSQNRAKLHAEFAGRRLQEVSEIAESDRGNKDELVKSTVGAFQRELNLAQDELNDIKTEKPDEVVDVVLALNRKANEFSAALETSSAEEETVKVAVEEAKETVEQVNAENIETLVETHETTPEDQTRRNLEREFRTQLTNLQGRVSISENRLDVILNVIESSQVPIDEERIDYIRAALVAQDDKFSSAMDALAAGGFRKAFQLLAEINLAIDEVEDTLTEIEIEVTTFSQPDEEMPVSEVDEQLE